MLIFREYILISKSVKKVNNQKNTPPQKKNKEKNEAINERKEIVNFKWPQDLEQLKLAC